MNICALLERIKKDAPFRIKLFLLVSFVFNLFYSVFLFIVAQASSSKWFFITSVYYAFLSVARIFLFLQILYKKELASKIKSMLACGYFLLFINLIFSTMMFFVIYGNQLVKHHEITVITLATYTFASLTAAIISSIKYFKKNDYLYSSAKLISLISASVSLVTLTNAMLSTFGENNALLRSIILPLLSGAVSVFIIACALFTIRKANSDLRRLKNEKARK